MLEKVHSPDYLRTLVQSWRKEGYSVALVPTMGALHEGHLELVRLAARHADKVIVSIFVNPAQFAAHEDFGTYPRTLEDDIAKLRYEPAHAVYAPDAGTMYPEGFDCTLIPGGPARELESVARPHFFAGVALVVTKLFMQTGADFAVFGEKDYQQLKVVEQLVRDLDIPIQIIPAPVFREPDGLARSSRNVYLSEMDRKHAPGLYTVLQQLSREIAGGRPPLEALSHGMELLQSTGFEVDYLEMRHAETLIPLPLYNAPARLLVAARLGATRLIDNIAVAEG